MTKPLANILVAEDEEVNIEIITDALMDEPYRISVAKDGVEAWELLQKKPESFDLILLDWMMPRMDGMEVLRKVKSHRILKTIPVIFQTARAKNDEIIKGLQEGAYYYLTKPYEPETLVTIVKAALTDYASYKSLKEKIEQTANAISLIKSGRFEFQTLTEGNNLATLLANACPDPRKSVVGLWELLMNAVEHGNLSITYDDKSKLNEKNEWNKEIERRMSLPENVDKKVSITCESSDDEIRFLIKDEGEGFDWKPYLILHPDRVFDNHGRGIAMAGIQSFDRIEYKGKGNEVLAVIDKKK